MAAGNQLVLSLFTDKWRPRFFMGKNKVMQFAIGKDEEDEKAPGIHKLSEVSIIFYYISALINLITHRFASDACRALWFAVH